MAAKSEKTLTEVERKLDVEPDFRVPELADPDLAVPKPADPDRAGTRPGTGSATAVGAGAAAANGRVRIAELSEPETLDLHATYFDTEDLRLIGQAITLRRRTGGHDSGWHLKLPRPDGERDELHRPLGRSARNVPRQLRERVEVHLRGAPLVQVVDLATTRVLRKVVAEDGKVLAELADDTVTATRPGREPVTWRELEVELDAGDAAVLDELVNRLVAAGARPSSSRSKLARSLGDPPRAVRCPRPPGVRRSSSAAVLLAYLDDQAGRLIDADPRVRDDVDGATRQLVLAARRLAGVLDVFHPLLERGPVEPLQDELCRLAGVLAGPARVELIRDQVQAALSAEPPELVPGPVSRRVAAGLRVRARQARAEVLAELGGERYFGLLQALDALLAAPPLTALALERREMVLPALLDQAWRRVAQLVRAASQADPQERGRRQAELCAAAERARYAGRALVPGFGKPAAEFAARMKAVQEAAAPAEESVLVRTALLELAAEAAGAGENTFGYGRLHALQQFRAEQVGAEIDRVWQRAARADYRRWLQ